MGAKQKLTSDLTKVMTEGLDPKKDKKAMDDLKKYAENVAKAISKFVTGLTVAGLVDNNPPNTGEPPNTSIVPLTDITGGATIMEKALLTANMGPNPPSSGVNKYSKGVAKAIVDYSKNCGLGPGTILVAAVPPGPNTSVPNPTPLPVIDAGGAITLQKDLIKLEGTAIPYGTAVATAISTYFLTLVIPAGAGLVSIIGPAPAFPVLGTPINPVAISEG